MHIIITIMFIYAVVILVWQFLHWAVEAMGKLMKKKLPVIVLIVIAGIASMIFLL